LQILIEGRPHTFQLMSQAPQVSVGPVPRYDLVAGRVNLTIDAVSNVPVYLDEKLQKIDVFGVPVLLRFCSNFQTVTLNGRPFPTNFGARLPFTITLPGSGKHYFRFSTIAPNVENAIQAFISANYGGDWNERNNHFGKNFIIYDTYDGSASLNVRYVVNNIGLNVFHFRWSWKRGTISWCSWWKGPWSTTKRCIG